MRQSFDNGGAVKHKMFCDDVQGSVQIELEIRTPVA